MFVCKFPGKFILSSKKFLVMFTGYVYLCENYFVFSALRKKKENKKKVSDEVIVGKIVGKKKKFELKNKK